MERNADDRRFISGNQRPRQRRERISGNLRMGLTDLFFCVNLISIGEGGLME